MGMIRNDQTCACDVTMRYVTMPYSTAVRDIPVSDNGSTWFATKSRTPPHILSSVCISSDQTIAADSLRTGVKEGRRSARSKVNKNDQIKVDKYRENSDDQQY